MALPIQGRQFTYQLQPLSRSRVEWCFFSRFKTSIAENQHSLKLLPCWVISVVGKAPMDQRDFKDERDFKRMSRRELLKLSPVLLAGVAFIPTVRDRLMADALRLTDWADSRIFRKNHLAPTYADSQVAPPSKFFLNSFDVDDPEVDFNTWRLNVSGLVKKPGQYTLADIQRLPRQSQNVRHVCVEGWDVIANFAGTRISDFLDHVGADKTARFLYFECADDYYESLDMETALHAQSLLSMKCMASQLHENTARRSG